MKNQKGITLIGLVITIIVILILAAVSISTLTGEEGILSRAETAGDTQKEKSVEEELTTEYSAYLAQTYQDGYKENQNYDRQKEALSRMITGLKAKGLEEVDASKNLYKYKGYEFELYIDESDNGKLATTVTGNTTTDSSEEDNYIISWNLGYNASDSTNPTNAIVAKLKNSKEYEGYYELVIEGTGQMAELGTRSGPNYTCEIDCWFNYNTNINVSFQCMNVVSGDTTEINKIKKITISDGITSIPMFAFAGFENLEEIYIGNDIINIEGSVFLNCATLNSINYNGTKSQWKNISLESYWMGDNTGSLGIVAPIDKINCLDGTLNIIQFTLWSTPTFAYENMTWGEWGNTHCNTWGSIVVYNNLLMTDSRYLATSTQINDSLKISSYNLPYYSPYANSVIVGGLSYTWI